MHMAVGAAMHIEWNKFRGFAAVARIACIDNAKLCPSPLICIQQTINTTCYTICGTMQFRAYIAIKRTVIVLFIVITLLLQKKSYIFDRLH